MCFFLVHGIISSGGESCAAALIPSMISACRLLPLFFLLRVAAGKEEEVPAAVFSSHERGGGNSWLFTSLSSLLLVSVEEGVRPEIHVMVGGVDSHYLDNLKHHANLYIHPLSGIKEQVWSRKQRNWRGGWNYLRCLNLSTHTPTAAAQGVIIVEDDVIFANHFWSQFRQQRTRIQRDFSGQDYVLDLYARFSKAPKDRSRLYTQKVRSFCCTQCMYYSAGATGLIQQELRANLAKVRHWGYDMSIKHVLQRRELPMFNSYPTLAQHIGIHSSIGSFQFHRSSHFRLGTHHATYDAKTGAIHYNATATHRLLREKLQKLRH